MAEGIVSFLLEKLTSVIREEYTQLEGFESDVQYIRDELESMQAFLRITEAKQDADILNEEEKKWYKQVMDVAYETEDVIDEFLLLYGHPKRAGFRGGVRHVYNSVKNVPARHHISSKIREIKNRVTEISARHQRYQSNEGISETISRRITENEMRGHALLLKDADLVGIDGPKGDIISSILTNESNLKAISVTGMAGLGKTTLVKRVFEAPDVKRAFSLHAWLTLSETFIIGDALKNLIQQLCKDGNKPTPDGVQSMNVDQLRAFVRDFLRDKRYIIVLDDLWKLVDWNSIKLVFPDDICGSSMIITTRKIDLATMCCREFHGVIHKMNPLSKNESWKLFCKKTFGESSCPPHLHDISHRIMRRCEGLPLGIVAIGGLLASKDTNNLDEWERVLRNLGGELESNGLLDAVRKILLLSYNDLPYYLKSCLLYMGIFSEDEIVDTVELAFLWISEGFVELRPGMTTIEVAQSYINELICRSLIHVEYTELDGRIRSCRVHDLTYKIILSKCKEHNILTTSSTPPTNLLKNARRLVVDDSNFIKEHVHMSHLRSLIRSHKSPSSLSNSSLSKLLSGTSMLLKVLHLEASPLNIIPKDVFKLSNLTYLNLSNTNVKHIPGDLRKLQNLEYLLLENTMVMELPADIIRLKKLCYIMVHVKPPDSLKGLRFSGFKAPYEIGELFSLQCLEYIEANTEKVIHEIGKLTQLRQLGITKITRENGRKLCSSLEQLTNLKKLHIQAITQNEILDLEYRFFLTPRFLHDLFLSGRLVNIPKWVPFCHGLSKVSLVNSSLSEDPLGSLQGLPNLVSLYLREAYTGELLNFKAGGFQKLKHLELIDLRSLILVGFEKGTLSSLETLYIVRCILLKEPPLYIEHLSKLRILYLQDMHKKLDNMFRSLDKESGEITKIDIVRNINGILEHDQIWW